MIAATCLAPLRSEPPGLNFRFARHPGVMDYGGDYATLADLSVLIP